MVLRDTELSAVSVRVRLCEIRRVLVDVSTSDSVVVSDVVSVLFAECEGVPSVRVDVISRETVSVSDNVKISVLVVVPSSDVDSLDDDDSVRENDVESVFKRGAVTVVRVKDIETDREKMLEKEGVAVTVWVNDVVSEWLGLVSLKAALKEGEKDLESVMEAVPRTLNVLVDVPILSEAEDDTVNDALIEVVVEAELEDVSVALEVRDRVTDVEVDTLVDVDKDTDCVPLFASEMDALAVLIGGIVTVV